MPDLGSTSLLRRMTGHDLKSVLTWRNHPDVRQYMYTQHEISIDEHTRWFERASRDPRKHLLIFEQDDVPLGFVNFSLTDSTGVADWGFYAAPEASKGSGRRMGHEALSYAFEQISLHKVCGQALAYNNRSIKFHLNQGFRQEGILRDQHFDGRHYHDVVCFGLLASEWPAST